MTALEMLDLIEQRANATTSGPWAQSDAEFIAHARTDVPALVDALRAVLQIMDDDDTPFQVAGYVEDAITEALGADA